MAGRAEPLHPNSSDVNLFCDGKGVRLGTIGTGLSQSCMPYSSVAEDGQHVSPAERIVRSQEELVPIRNITAAVVSIDRMSLRKEAAVTSPAMPPDGAGQETLPGASRASTQPAELARETVDKIARALGHGLAQCWSRLAQDIQHDVFETAVTLEGEAIRQQLAIYLHGKHTRTTDAMQARATSEPDSLGG